jgi:hypothetical protein
LLQHFDRGIGALRRVGLGVGGDDFQLPAEHTALGVDLGDGELGAFQGAIVIRLDEARERDRRADNDGILGTGLIGRAENSGNAEAKQPGQSQRHKPSHDYSLYSYWCLLSLN